MFKNIESIVAIVDFLLSDKALSITRQNIFVDAETI